MITYERYVLPYLHNFVPISISENRSKEIKQFAEQVIKKKESESHHKIDRFNEFKRWYTGMAGEAALEVLLGKEFINFNIGDSKSFHVSDLKSIGLDVGVKTVEYGKFPVIFKNSYKPEIIILKENDLKFFICGLAKVRVLNQYQSDELILSPMLRNRGTKTGFYGFSELDCFDNFKGLTALLR